MEIRGKRGFSSRGSLFIAVALLGSSSLLSVSAALAQTSSQSIETVVVSARVPDPVGNQAFSVIHLDQNDLSASPQLDSALAQVPGLSLFRRDSSLTANPTTQGVSLRDFAPSGAGRTLVTLDGVPQNDPFGAWVIWSALPSEDIDSAEVVQGAGAGPYGAGALTGTITLSEAQGDGVHVADVSGGDHDFERAAASGGTQLGPVTLFASASYESEGGFIPILPPTRGAADAPDSLVARNASLSASYAIDPGTVVVARASVFDEERGTGTVGGDAGDNGIKGSLTIAHPESADSLGWRLQGWAFDSDFHQTSVAIAAGRVSTTPSNLQYATPALGLGMNAALRGELDWLNWEIGADARFDQGESQEEYSYVSGAYTMGRLSGGRTAVEGLYAEGASHVGPWLFTLGVRGDAWNETSGHLIQSTLATGAVALNQIYPNHSGIEPTARAGIKRDLSDGFYARTAAYKGFRAASLNELYRPFRVGNNITEGNAALTPEELYGAELGGGFQDDTFSWDGDYFWNTLHNAITSVTIAKGPISIPYGVIPAGGLLIERENVGNIGAHGVESNAHWQADSRLRLNFAFQVTDAKVNGGVLNAQITGKQPAQAPRWTVTGGFLFNPTPKLSISTDLHYESNRWADDQNSIALGTAATVDMKVAYKVTDDISAYVSGANLFNAKIGSTASAGSAITYTNPRILTVGLSYKP